MTKMFSQDAAWLRIEIDRIVEKWREALHRQGLSWGEAEETVGHNVVDELIGGLERKEPVLPDTLSDAPSAALAFASVACLREAVLTVARSGRGAYSDSDGLSLAIHAQLDHWMTEMGSRDEKRIDSKPAEGALPGSDRLERAKTDFVNIAAHEIKTPLTLIRGYASILCEEAEWANATRFLELGRGVLAGADRLGRLTDALIDVATIDLGILELHYGVVSLGNLVTMAIADVYAEAPSRHHHVTVRGLNTLPPIRGDAQRLYQVLLQVIGNAMKYTPDGGQIEIAGRVRYRDENGCANSYVELCVSDTGIGIDPRDGQAVFEKFFRTGDPSLHSTSKARFKGAGPGLGLTIARGIVRAHGGAMWAESAGHDEERCPGASFYILLPVTPNVTATRRGKLADKELPKSVRRPSVAPSQCAEEDDARLYGETR